MKRLRWVLLLLFLGRALAWQQVVSDRVEVLYPEPALKAYAAEVARQAEAALDVLEPLFGKRPGRVVLQLNDRVDWFNAYATTIPRRSVELLAPMPASSVIDLRSPSVTYLLLVHELTHTRQLTFRQKPNGKEPPRFGLVSELSAPMPPAWFTEGIATFMESRFTPGGRLDWAHTQALLNGLLQEEGKMPDLADMSLYTYRDWPSWQTRYLLGVRFVDYLIEKHGWEAVLKTLRQYNGGFLVNPPFASAWRAAAGTDLREEWRGWVDLERKRQAAYASVALPFERFLDNAAQPAVSPDSRRLAFVRDGYVWLAAADGTAPRRLAPAHPQKLWWADNHTLLYSRYFHEGDAVVSDVFALDADSGRETRLTRDRHARLAAPAPNGCFYYLRSRMGQADAVVEHCAQGERTVWQAGEGERVVGLAVSPGGRVALSVWHRGNVDLALIEGGKLRYLAAGRLAVRPPAPPPDPCAGGAANLGPCPRGSYHQHLDPVWNGDYELAFRADEGGVFDLYRLSFPTGRIERLTVLPGGVEGAAVAADGYLVSTLGPDGSQVGRPALAAEPVRLLDEAAPSTTPVPQTELRLESYSPLPSLAPYGWLFYPAAHGGQPSLEAAVFGLDDTRTYSYRLAFGYAPLSSGPLGGSYAFLQAGWRAGVDLVGSTAPLGFTLRAGAWPSSSFSIESGVMLGMASTGAWDRWSWRVGAEAGPVWDGVWGLHWHATGRLAREKRDPWGYLDGGGYLNAAAGNGYELFSTVAAWQIEPFGLKTSLEARLIAGQGVYLGPGVDGGSGAVVEARLRYSRPTRWRSGDGWLALERLTFAPGLRAWYDGSPGYGAELGLYADITWLYMAPIPIGFRVGYADGWWWRLEVGPW
ncbi:hypothetical protein [Oceanithermus sp.]